MLQKIIVILTITVLIALAIKTLYQRYESFTINPQGWYGDPLWSTLYRTHPQPYGTYKNLALTSKPIVHNLPNPVYEWFEHLKPYNLLHQPNLYGFNPADNISQSNIGVETDTKGTYPFCIYGNQKKFCSEHPATTGCPNNWLHKKKKNQKVSWGNTVIKTF